MSTSNMCLKLNLKIFRYQSENDFEATLYACNISVVNVESRHFALKNNLLQNFKMFHEKKKS